MKLLYLLFLALLVTVCWGLTPSSFLTESDRARLKKVFERAWTSKDLSSVYYAVKGYRQLGEAIPDAQGICKFVQSKGEGVVKPETLYLITGTSKELERCSLNFSPQAHKSLEAVLIETPSVQDIFYAFYALKRMGHPTDDAKLVKTLLSALKRDDSVLNLGYSFHVASELQGDVQSIFERIEDAIVQADEVDGRMLQFEGGLSVTATILSGAYALGKHVGKAPTITGDQAVKFANYFLSRRSVQQAKGAFLLLHMFNILAENKFHVPVAVTLSSSIAVSGAVRVRITDLLGRPLGPLTVTAENDPMLEKTPMKAVPNDKSLYEMDLLKLVTEAGFYELSISVSPAKLDPRLVGTTGAKVTVKVLTKVAVHGAELGVSDADHSTISKHIMVKHPESVKEALYADYHQKVWMKFSLKDEQSKELLVHQAFIRLQKHDTAQEIIFVAEPDTNKVYKFDMDLHAKAKEFGSLSGTYKMELIIGDPVIANPFVWHVANLNLKFADEAVAPEKKYMYKPKPEIKHIFREPEKRPPAIVSNTFTVLVFLPLLLMLVIWIRLGVNISNFPLSISSILFHASLSGIFGIFAMFWLELNMFTTIKYLICVGIVAFLSGNSLLAKIAENRKNMEKLSSSKIFFNNPAKGREGTYKKGGNQNK